MEIAFIGLGNMGSGMAANLAAAGHRVRAFDLSSEALEQARQNGCTIMRSVAEAVIGAEAVVSMLPNGEIVRAVYREEVFPHAGPGTLLVECSTIDLATARALTAEAGGQGFAMVDAPASGGIAGAKAGALTFMVGGSDANFARAEAVLAPMAKAVIHAGASGCGQIAKMANNMLLAIHMIGTCEALALAGKAGLDPQVFQSIASKATGACWSLNDYTPMPGVGAPSPADNGYAGGFASALMLKDLRLAMEGAAGARAHVPMGEQATRIYEAFVASGKGALDFGAIFTTLE